jgi:hypothetical protein
MHLRAMTWQGILDRGPRRAREFANIAMCWHSYTAHYDFVRVHSALRISPIMMADVRPKQEKNGMTPTAFTIAALRAGKFLLPLLGLLGVGALIAMAVSDRTPEAYR